MKQVKRADFSTQTEKATGGEKPEILDAVALAVDRDGNSVLSQAVGKTSLDPATANLITQDSILTLASCTKLITAIAALCLVQQGKLDLDDTTVVAKHLPELCERDIITSAPDESLSLEKRKTGITVHQLLTHTSGPGYDILHPLLLAWRQSRGDGSISLTSALPEALAQPSLFQPGEGWTYGGGSDLTGLLITRLTSTSLGAFMKKEIFNIVCCDERIGFSRQEIAQHGEIVQVITRAENGALVPYPVAEQKSERGGGGLFSSPRNFIKILTDLITPNPKILTKDTRDILFKPQLQEPSKALSQLRQGSQLFTAMTGPLTSSLPDTAINHALGGLLITQDNELGKAKGTMAWGGAFSCLWFVNREVGVAAFYSDEVSPPTDGGSSKAMGRFVREVWARLKE